MANAALATDAYKLFHNSAYRDGITQVYDNYTNRSGRLSNIPEPDRDGVVNFGIQRFVKKVLIKEWNKKFFNRNKKKAMKYMKRFTSALLGFDYDITQFEKLHDLGYLPLHLKSLPEGVVVPYGVPSFTFYSTHKDFRWLPSYLETIMSCENWMIQTSATTSRAYLKNIMEAYDEAGLSHDGIPFMVHDFSMRGMPGIEAASMSGMGHLVSFAGTDTLRAIEDLEKYYNADITKELVGVSVPATEHSTATSFILSYAEEHGISLLDAEVAYVKYLFTKVPTGILSEVSDSFHFWKFIAEGLPKLRDAILARAGKFVIRPDTGDPVEVLCGKELNNVANNEEAMDDLSDYYDSTHDCLEPFMTAEICYSIAGKAYKVTYTPDLNRHDKTYYYVDNYGSWESHFKFEELEMTAEDKGLIQCLYEQFPGEDTVKGFKQLDERIGAIYGDSITLQRQKEIYRRLMDKGFAPSVVLGVGSYSYQYVTRDTHSSAVKTTWVKCDGKGVDVYKDPATDHKKKSAKGLMRVELENGVYVMYDEQTPEQEEQGELRTVFRDGKLYNETTLAEVRQRIKDSL